MKKLLGKSKSEEGDDRKHPWMHLGILLHYLDESMKFINMVFVSGTSQTPTSQPKKGFVSPTLKLFSVINPLTSIVPAFNTNWSPHPKRLPLSSTLSALESGQDPAWAELPSWPNTKFRKATGQIRSWFPTSGQPAMNIYDEWMCLRDPSERWTNEKLGYIVDLFPQICERFVLDGEDQYSPTLNAKNAKHLPYWYPTLLLNLEVKKALPEEGVKFLFTRLQTKAIKNGRYDLEVVVMDEGGDIVALSHHVCFVVSADRNTSARRKPDAGKL